MGFGKKRVKSRRNDALTRVDWRQLETLLATYYRNQGYQVEHTGTAGTGSKFDGGIDLKLRRPDAYVLVQVKHWNVFKVPHNDVHQLLGIMVNEGATGAIVVTSGEFTKAAIEAATRHGHVQLIDGEELRQMLGVIPEPPANTASPRSVAGTFAESAMERLMAAAEDRLRGHARRGASRAVKSLGIGLVLGKGLMFVLAVGAILWGFNLVVQGVTGSLAKPRANVQESPAPGPSMLPAPTVQVGQPALVSVEDPRDGFRQRTQEDAAEAKRRADEAMRVLAPNTPEVERAPANW